MRRSRKIREHWAGMSASQKIISIGAICTALVAAWVAIGTARSIAVQTVGQWPYANQSVEIIVAGWQFDRAKAELRDISDRIGRLQDRKKILGGKFDPDDQKTLNGLLRDRDNLERVIKQIDSTQRPVVNR